MFGIPAKPEQMIGADCSNAAEDIKYLFKDENRFVERIAEILREQKLVTSETIGLKDDRFFERDYIPIFFENIYLGHMWAYRDISEQITARLKLERQTKKLKEANAKLDELASHDGLTKLTNRRTMLDQIKREIRRSDRNKKPLSLIMLDVDKFKSYNDKFGHLEGDYVLKTLAEILLKTGRMMDAPCRYGGEEFAIILPETNQEEAQIAAERIRTEIENYQWKNRKITASLGITTINFKEEISSNAAIINKLIKEADEALYSSKENGRNRVTHFKELKK